MSEKIVTKVWIAPGCIICDACETECPEVFDVQEQSSTIRSDGQKPEFVKLYSLGIIKAAEACPAEVIKFEATEVAGEEPAKRDSQAIADAKPAELERKPCSHYFQIPSAKALKNPPLDARLGLSKK